MATTNFALTSGSWTSVANGTRGNVFLTGGAGRQALVYVGTVAPNISETNVTTFGDTESGNSEYALPSGTQMWMRAATADGCNISVMDVGASGTPVTPTNPDGSAQTTLPPGRAAAASSVPTVLSTEDFARLGTVAFGGGTGATTSVTSSATALDLKAANAARVGLIIANDSTAILYVLLGSGTPSLTNYSFALPAKGTVAADRTITGYTGIVRGVWASANGAALVTEIT